MTSPSPFPSAPPSPLRVTALAASAQLGGTERVLLDFAARAFEFDIALAVLTPRDGPLIEILHQIGVPAEVVPGPTALLRGSQQPGRLWSLAPAALALPAWAWRLARHRRWRDADVLYSIGFKTHFATTLRHDRPLVWHLHEFPPERMGRVWRALARRVPNAAIANSRAVGEAWKGTGNGERGTGNGRGPRPSLSQPVFSIIPNGVDLDRFRPRDRSFWVHDRLGIPRDRRLLGMPAVFARWKGQEAVLQAFELVRSEFPTTHLVFVGGSIYDTVAEREFGLSLQRLVAERCAASGEGKDHSRLAQVHILPFQSKIEATYAEFDLVLHYSLRPEPFGRVILEAMASGVPVMAAAEGGPVEILGGGRPVPPSPFPVPPGWLVSPREPAALAAALRTALALPREDLLKIGRLGRARAEDHFSARGFARGVAEVLRVVARPAPAR